MKASVLISSLFAMSAAAVPATTVKSKNYTDTFDNRTTLPGVDQSNIVDCTAGGALCYNAFVVSTADPLVETAPSAPNVILTAALAGQNTEGQPAIYVNSTYKCFTPKSISYAITLNSEQSVGNVAESGTIQFAGVKYSTSGIGTTVIQEAIYNPNLTQIPFVFGSTKFASSFDCVTRMNIQLLQATGGNSPLLATVMFDNVAYTVFYK